MSTGRTELPSQPVSQAATGGIRPEELRFSEARLSSVGTQTNDPQRRTAVLQAVEALTGSNGIAAHAIGFGATAAAATALLASGVSPAIAGTAALTGVVASVLSPNKGNGRG